MPLDPLNALVMMRIDGSSRQPQGDLSRYSASTISSWLSPSQYRRPRAKSQEPRRGSHLQRQGLNTSANAGQARCPRGQEAERGSPAIEGRIRTPPRTAGLGESRGEFPIRAPGPAQNCRSRGKVADASPSIPDAFLPNLSSGERPQSLAGRPGPRSPEPQLQETPVTRQCQHPHYLAASPDGQGSGRLDPPRRTTPIAEDPRRCYHRVPVARAEHS